jgi:putative methylase
VDLGCGTGVFSVGAAILGANKVIGIDTDVECISVAKIFANSHNLNNITFISKDVSDSVFSADTVIMNPPFGAQKGNIHADQVFLKKAIQNADVVYSLHLTKTLSHLKRYAETLHAETEIVSTFNFPLKGQFEFHKKLKENVSVSCLRFVHSSAEKEEACK